MDSPRNSPVSDGDRSRSSTTNRRDPFADGIDRRRLMRSSAAAGATAALAGCVGDDGDGDERVPTVYAFNNGDRTVTVIDAETDEALETVHVDTTASFPANHVAVVDHAERDVVATVDTGESPTGAVGGTVRPETSARDRLRGSLAALGLEFGEREATYCPEDNCYCG